MPTLILHTNIHPSREDRKALLATLSAAVAEHLGKPERYVLVSWTRNPDMLFGGSEAPLAYLELKSLDLPEDQTPALSRRLCTLLEEQGGIPADRVYIEFASPPRHLFGWNGATF